MFVSLMKTVFASDTQCSNSGIAKDIEAWYPDLESEDSNGSDNDCTQGDN
jgi:hypothetical protein